MNRSAPDFFVHGLETSTPQQFVAFQQREHTRWKQLVEARKITAD